MRELRGLGIVLCFAVVLAGAMERLVNVDPAKCGPLSREQQAWLRPDWAKFGKFVKSCAVRETKATALYVISVWQDEYYGTLDAAAPAVNFPKPILVAPDGRTIGELPMGFPRDQPRTLDVTFGRWLHGFPREVRLWVEDPTVVGNHSLPALEWDARAARFIQTKNREEMRNGDANRR